MLRFILHTGVLLGAFALIIQAISMLFPMSYYNQEYPMWKYQQEVAMGEQGKKEARKVILGDSRAMAGIRPDLLGNTLSLCVGGATPVELYFNFKRYIVMNQKPDTVIFSLTPLHFYRQDCFYHRTRKYDFLEDWMIDSVKQVAFALNDPEYTSAFGLVNKIKLLSFTSKMVDMNVSHLSRYGENKAKYQAMSERNGHSFFGTKEMDDGYNLEVTDHLEMDESGQWKVKAGKEKFVVSKVNDYYFKKLLDLLRDENIFIVWVTMPMNRASYDKLKLMPTPFLQDYSNYVKANFAERDRWIGDFEVGFYENEYFGDPAHLNERGSVKFTEALIEKYFR